jgi:hypothetical protein
MAERLATLEWERGAALKRKARAERLTVLER